MTKPKSSVSVNIDFKLADAIGEQAALRGVRGATLEAERILVDILSQPGSGEVYKRGSRTHRASAPGEAPAPDTGRLRASRDTEIFATPGGAHGVISVNAEYAAALELGTERVDERPFISKVLQYGARLKAAFEATAK